MDKNKEHNDIAKPSTNKEKKPILVDTDDTFQAVLKTYEHVQHWITLADTKAGLVLTIQGVLVGFILQQMMIWKATLFASTTPSFAFYTIIIALCCYFILKIISFLHVIKVFFPRVLKEVNYSNTKHIFSIGISKEFPNASDSDKFWQEYQKLTETDLKREYVYQIHIDNLVCSLKYISLSKSMKALLLSIVFAFIVFVSTVVFL